MSKATEHEESSEFVTIAAYPDPATAHVARTALEAAGIPVFLQGENANNLIPIAFFARLQVRSQDQEAAREVLGANDLTSASFEETNEE